MEGEGGGGDVATSAYVKLRFLDDAMLDSSKKWRGAVDLADRLLNSIIAGDKNAYLNAMCNPESLQEGTPYLWPSLIEQCEKNQAQLLGAFEFKDELHLLLGNASQKVYAVWPIVKSDTGEVCFNPQELCNPPIYLLHNMILDSRIPGSDTLLEKNMMVVPWDIGPKGEAVDVMLPLCENDAATTSAVNTFLLVLEKAISSLSRFSSGSCTRDELIKELDSIMTPETKNVIIDMTDRCAAGTLFYGTLAEVVGHLSMYGQLIKSALDRKELLVVDYGPFVSIVPVQEGRLINSKDVMVKSDEGIRRNLGDFWKTKHIVVSFFRVGDSGKLFGMMHPSFFKIYETGSFRSQCESYLKTVKGAE